MKPRAFACLISAIVCAVIAFGPSSLATSLVFAGVSAIVALGLVLMISAAGLTSFGQAAFVGVGAYASALVTTKTGASTATGLAASIAASAIAAALLGALTMRLKSWFLPLGTLAAGLAVYYAFGTSEFLGGHTGFGGVPGLAPQNLPLTQERLGGIAVWITVGLLTVLLLNLLNSRMGRAMKTLRGKSIVGESFGIDTAKLKFAVFVIAGIMAGLAGWFYVHIVRFVNPTPFSLNASIEYLFVAVVGGVGSLWGAIIGALVAVPSRQFLVEVMPGLTGGKANVETIIFGLLIILLLQRTRKGIVDLLPAMPIDNPRLPKPTPQQPDPQERKGTPADAFLEIADVSKSFGGLKAVSNVSFRVPCGSIVGLVGPNGAGKSTLFNIISGITKGEGGRIVFAGREIQQASPRQIVKLGLSRTFQHVQLRHDLTCVENVAIGAHLQGTHGILSSMLRLDRREETELLNQSVAQLSRVGLAKEALLPAGKLPLGKQRLLEVARALAAKPQLLLLDEPAAGLRYNEKNELAVLLKSLRDEGLGILIVEHDMEFLMALADRVVVMTSGAILVEGTPEAIQADKRVVDAYLGAGELEDAK